MEQVTKVLNEIDKTVAFLLTLEPQELMYNHTITGVKKLAGDLINACELYDFVQDELCKENIEDNTPFFNEPIIANDSGYTFPSNKNIRLCKPRLRNCKIAESINLPSPFCITVKMESEDYRIYINCVINGLTTTRGFKVNNLSESEVMRAMKDIHRKYMFIHDTVYPENNKSGMEES